MTFAAQIVAVLDADVTLATILTGGVHEYQDSGPKGLNRVQIAEAFFKDTGLLKPTCILYEGDELADGQVIDMPTRKMSTVTPVTGWLYDLGNNLYTNIAAAEARIYTLLHGMRVTSGFQVLWGTTVKNKREPLLEYACYWQFVARVYGLRS